MKTEHAIAASVLVQRFTRHIQVEGAKVMGPGLAKLDTEGQVRALLGHIAGLEAMAGEARSLLAKIDGADPGKAKGTA